LGTYRRVVDDTTDHLV